MYFLNPISKCFHFELQFYCIFKKHTENVLPCSLYAMLIHSLEILEISITQTKEVHFVSPTTDIRNQEFLLKKKKFLNVLGRSRSYCGS